MLIPEHELRNRLRMAQHQVPRQFPSFLFMAKWMTLEANSATPHPKGRRGLIPKVK